MCYAYKTYLRNGSEIISNPQNVSDRLNSFIIQSVGDLLNWNNSRDVHTWQQRLHYCPNTMFVYPVTENEVV